MNARPPGIATKHYEAYPEGEYPIWLAYGFRPVFLVLAPYMVASIVVWGLAFTGKLPIPLPSQALTWHIYESLFGIGTGGIIAFVLTGLPEMFPGVVPIVGRRLQQIVGLWLAARLSFWLMDYVSVYVVAALNVAVLSIVLAQAFRPILLDPQQRHASIGYTLVGLLGVMLWFFASMAGFVGHDALSILRVGVGVFMVLILLVIRRVNMEVVNELIEDEGLDDVFIARAPRYNLAIFTVVLFTAVEFYYSGNRVLGWLGFAAGAAALGVLNDFILDEARVLTRPLVLLMAALPTLIGVGYGMLGYGYLLSGGAGVNHFRHLLTTGAFGLGFYIVMVVITHAHTGRRVEIDRWTGLGGALVILASLVRAAIAYFPAALMTLYLASALLWGLAFGLYIWRLFPYLLAPRVDGLPG